MNIKKWITLVLLLIANLSIIAHNVTPHHHHDGVVCTASAYGNECCDENNEDSHQHDSRHCHDSFGECELQKTMMREAGTNHIQFDVPLITLMVHHCCGLSSCHMEEPDFATFFRQKPYLDSYYTTYVSPTIGLRAPPRISFLG